MHIHTCMNMNTFVRIHILQVPVEIRVPVPVEKIIEKTVVQVCYSAEKKPHGIPTINGAIHICRCSPAYPPSTQPGGRVCTRVHAMCHA